MKKHLDKSIVLALTLPFVFSCGGGSSPVDPVEPVYYTITWNNYDGTTLGEDRVKAGTMPIYGGSTPSKPKTDEYTYKFSSWTPEVVPAVKNTTYTATFKEIENYKVIWLDGDGSKLKEEVVDVETTPSYKGVVPYKANVGETYYYFDKYKLKNTNESNYQTLTYEPVFKECSKTDDQDYDGLEDYLDPTPTKPSFKTSVSYNFGGGDTDKISSAEFKLNYKDMFINGNENIFSKDIAKFGAILNNSSLITSYGKITTNEDIKPRKDYSDIFARLGCDDTLLIDLSKEETYSLDKNDVCSVYLAHRSVKDMNSNDEHDFIYIVVKPTDNKINEWLSYMDIGYKGSQYYDKEGNNHESAWIDNNSQYHKGMFIAANRLLNNSKFKQFIEKYNNPTIFLTGHSRAGGIANILGKLFKSDSTFSSLKTFVYTYACPNTYFGDKDSTCTNIFNIINENDFIPLFPLEQWSENGKNATRFGTDKSLMFSDVGYSRYFKEIGRNYTYVANLKTTLNKILVAENIPTRDALYKNDDAKIDKTYTSKIDAENRVSNYKSMLGKIGFSSGDINNYFPLKITETQSNFVISGENSIGGILKAGAYVICGATIDDYLLAEELVHNYYSIGYELKENGLTSINAAAISNYPTTYYLLCDLL